jgi:hypothetical protein
VAWLDQPGTETAQILGNVTEVLPGARHQPKGPTVTARLRDGSTVTCSPSRLVNVGDPVTALKRTSRILGRTTYEVMC